MTQREKMNAEGELHRKVVRSSVAENSVFDRAYAVMNILATIVASYGLLADSAAVVIGAMVIAMLLGPISGVALALVDGDNRLLREALTALIAGVLLVFVTAFLIGFFNKEIPASREMMDRTAPNLFDLMIALGGGAAGAYAVISPRLSVAFVGVAIATALVPPLSTCGMFLARGQFALSGGAFLLTLTNIVAIQFASSVVFYLNGFCHITKGKKQDRGVLVEDLVSVVLLLVLGAVLTANFHALVSKEIYETAIRKALKSAVVQHPGAYLADVRFSRTDGSVIVQALVRGPAPLFCPAGSRDGILSAAPAWTTALGIACTLCVYNGDVWKRPALPPKTSPRAMPGNLGEGVADLTLLGPRSLLC